ncbi:lysophospholipid acyltransferase 5-like [Artemia franciscana]|uniref:lysophospholipid acyltransferase 5-like n=1 Tax=Artemia franciscana TaxID=6661 RepID=UPI0032DBEFCF
MLEQIAKAIGASETSLRLIVSILLGYPLSYIYTKYLKNFDVIHKHFFFFLSGFCIGVWNFGFDIVHSLVAVLVTYISLQVAGGTTLSVVFSFVFHMAYLLVGYWVTATKEYDIKWTMPHCVLVLRHIALTFDVADGKVPEEKLSSDQKKNHLKNCPSLLEIAAHTYFPGGFLVGPQFTMRRYLDFVCNRFDSMATGKGNNVKFGFIRGLMGLLYVAVYQIGSSFVPDSIVTSSSFLVSSILIYMATGKGNNVKFGFIRGLMGLLYVAVYQIGSSFVPDSIVTSSSFLEYSLFIRLCIVGIWVKISLYKYISCWLISEGVCIVSGLTFNGVQDGWNMWDGCANVKLHIYENITRFGQMVPSFNLNTNIWAAQYVYKRCRFLGNKMASQVITLAFLATWHGWHSGYYVTFFNEFIILKWEKDAEFIISKNPRLQNFLSQKPVKIATYILLKFYFILFLGYALTPFVLLKSEKWLPVYSNLYYSGTILFLSLDLVLPLFGRFLIPRRKKEE